MTELKRWLSTFTQDKYTWYHKDRRIEVLSHTQIQYLTWKRDWYIKKSASQKT